jgi:riboflavin kinase/FMN adenylyltransferase
VPHPKVFADPSYPLIFTAAEKERILSTQGVDRLVLMDFEEICRMDGESFVREILMKRLRMAHIVVGERFRFGRGRSVGTDTLLELAADIGFEVSIEKPVFLNGSRISSSAIREKLQAGEVEAANRLLGESYYIDGRVSQGRQLGRELGFPTINLATRNTLLPEGVFATRVRVGSLVVPSVTNIGYRPTFKGSGKVVESHLIGYSGELYGRDVRLFFDKKIRDEMQFENQDELIEQIHRDIRSSGFDNESLF